VHLVLGKRMLILGGGIIGLEMGTVYGTLAGPDAAWAELPRLGGVEASEVG
jgi:hypothetical protein